MARALYTLPRFNTNLVSLIITQASPHLAPVLALDPYLLGKDKCDGGLFVNRNIEITFSVSQLHNISIRVNVKSLLRVDFYSAVRQKWQNQANKLRNVTVLSVGGGYRDYQVRSGLTSLSCPPGDPNKLSLVVSVVSELDRRHLTLHHCRNFSRKVFKELKNLSFHFYSQDSV